MFTLFSSSVNFSLLNHKLQNNRVYFEGKRTNYYKAWEKTATYHSVLGSANKETIELAKANLIKALKSYLPVTDNTYKVDKAIEQLISDIEGRKGQKILSMSLNPNLTKLFF